jgi:hypothetical protein
MPENGRIPRSELVRIHHPRGIPVFLRDDAAVAWEDMRRESVQRLSVNLYPLGPASAYRSLEQQQFFWNLFQRGGNPAAPPGSSNHGWGVAVDVGDPDAATSQRQWSAVRRIGLRYGWSWDEGSRVGEPWHFRYVGGYKPDPLRWLTARERSMVRELSKLRALPAPTPAQVERRKAVWRRLRDQRKRIFRAAKDTGWEQANRRQRYEILRRVTKT